MAFLDCKTLPFKPRAAERESPGLLFSHSVTSLQSHELQPTRLLCSWDFLGKNTGVGYHFFLQGGLSDPGVKPASLALADRFFTTEPPGKLQRRPYINLNWDPVSNKPFGQSFVSTNHTLCLVTICPYSNSPLSTSAPNDPLTPLGHLLLPAGPLAGHAQ